MGPYPQTDSLNSVFNEEFSAFPFIESQTVGKYLSWFQVKHDEKKPMYKLPPFPGDRRGLLAKLAPPARWLRHRPGYLQAGPGLCRARASL